MPTCSDGLVQIVMTTVYNDTEALNVFYYWNGTNTPVLDLAGVLSAFDAKVFPDIANIFNVGTSIGTMEARDVFGSTPDKFKVPSVGAGTVVGEIVNNFTACRINLLPTTKETRRGYKRFGGISESSVAGNGLTTAFKTVVEGVGNLLDDDLTVGAETYSPVIFGGPTASNPTRSVANYISSTAVPNKQVSQGSRKV